MVLALSHSSHLVTSASHQSTCFPGHQPALPKGHVPYWLGTTPGKSRSTVQLTHHLLSHWFVQKNLLICKEHYDFRNASVIFVSFIWSSCLFAWPPKRPSNINQLGLLKFVSCTHHCSRLWGATWSVMGLWHHLPWNGGNGRRTQRSSPDRPPSHGLWSRLLAPPSGWTEVFQRFLVSAGGCRSCQKVPTYSTTASDWKVSASQFDGTRRQGKQCSAAKCEGVKFLHQGQFMMIPFIKHIQYPKRLQNSYVHAYKVSIWLILDPYPI